MFKVKTIDNISEKGLDLLEDDFILDQADDADAILLRSTNIHEMDFDPKLKSIARAGAGVNNIPLDRCAEEGIVVFNTPGANANAVKEIFLLGLFLASRDVVEGINWVEAQDPKKTDIAKAVEKQKKNYAGIEITGKALGLIGMGAIGTMAGEAAAMLDMEVFAYDPFLSEEAKENLDSRIEVVETLADIFSKSDYISLHLPFNEDTKDTIDKAALEKAKDGVRILNFARGGLVNNDDIKEALASGKVSRYVTDFPSNDLIGIKGIINIPHLGASTAESEENCAVMAVNQTMDYLKNGNIKNSVNYPDADMGKSEGKARLAIHNKNIPGMVGEITSKLAEEGVNIDYMINNSKGDYAYTLLDISCEPKDEVLEHLMDIEGIIRVRLIGGCDG